MSEMYYLEASAKIRHTAAISVAVRERLAHRAGNAERVRPGLLLRRRAIDFLRRSLPGAGRRLVRASPHR